MTPQKPPVRSVATPRCCIATDSTQNPASDAFPLADVEPHEIDYAARALFWRCYIAAVAVVIAGGIFIAAVWD